MGWRFSHAYLVFPTTWACSHVTFICIIGRCTFHIRSTGVLLETVSAMISTPLNMHCMRVYIDTHAQMCMSTCMFVVCACMYVLVCIVHFVLFFLLNNRCHWLFFNKFPWRATIMASKEPMDTSLNSGKFKLSPCIASCNTCHVTYIQLYLPIDVAFGFTVIPGFVCVLASEVYSLHDYSLCIRFMRNMSTFFDCCMHWSQLFTHFLHLHIPQSMHVIHPLWTKSVL